MEPEQRRLPLIPLRNANDNVNRPPVVQQQARPNQFQVNKIVGFVDHSTGIRYCTFLICGRLAEYKCQLIVSRHYRHYCHQCLERFRTDVVVCEADSTTTDA